MGDGWGVDVVGDEKPLRICPIAISVHLSQRLRRRFGATVQCRDTGTLDPHGTLDAMASPLPPGLLQYGEVTVADRMFTPGPGDTRHEHMAEDPRIRWRFVRPA
ncbi:hypothetical protein D3C76_1650860 [compost metagenome]